MKKVSTLVGIIIIVVIAVILFGGVFAYQYFTPKIQPVVQTQQTQNNSTACVAEGGSYGAPLTSADLCCAGLVEHPTSQSGTSGVCVKPTNQTAGWKTYTNTNNDYGFTFQYPINTEAKVDLSGGSWVTTLDIFAKNPKGEIDTKQTVSLALYAITTITMPDYPARAYWAENLSRITPGGRLITDSGNGETLIESKDGNFIIQIYPSDKQYQDIYNTVSSTFKFTNNNQPSIVITSPKGGEQWKIGSTQNIIWTSTGLTSQDKIAIELIGDTDPHISYEIVPASQAISAILGSYNWTIPASIIPGSTYHIILQDMYNNSSGKYSDSKNYFSIIK